MPVLIVFILPLALGICTLIFRTSYTGYACYTYSPAILEYICSTALGDSGALHAVQ